MGCPTWAPQCIAKTGPGSEGREHLHNARKRLVHVVDTCSWRLGVEITTTKVFEAIFDVLYRFLFLSLAYL